VAPLAGFAYVLGRHLDRRTIGVVEQQLHGIPGELAKKYPDLPELLRASVACQYDDGTTFVGQALAAGGWAAVDRVHLDPPESTEQVLHPQRYYDDRDRPIVVTLRGTDRLEATGFTRILEDTIGELGIRVLATRALPAGRVWSRTTAARPPGSAVEPEAVRPGTGHEAGVRREDHLQRGHGPQASGAACCCKAGASFL